MDFLTSSKKLLQTLAFTATFAMSSTAQAGLIFDEADLGDFNHFNLVTLALTEGTNQVLGKSVFRNIGPGVNDYDYDFDSFLFKVADGFSLTSVRYSAFAEAPDGVRLYAGYYLHAYDATNIWKSVLSFTEINLLSWDAQDMFTNAMPLSAGVYGFSNQSFGKSPGFEGRPWRYTIEFDVVSNNPAPVNAPGTLLLLSGVFGLLTWRRRNQ
jgi:hypothetical protein